MALLRPSADDVNGFKVLFGLLALYGLISYSAYFVIQMKFVTPLGDDAPLDRFSEARAIEHVRVLAGEIGGRQEGTQGLKKAAEYIKSQLGIIKNRAGPNFSVEIQETVVNGSFSMKFLGHSISLTYRGHTNILMRIASVDSQEDDPSILLNSHFDTAVGSPGAGDCGSCVASLLEVARLSVDSGWVPPHPIIFLFNGAEELFMLGSHGFITTHPWRDKIKAFINLEASGTGGFDLVCQSGPGSWPASVYAKSVPYPMGNSAAQDFFGAVPGDTDYRMFSADFGNIPGLDIIFLLGGYYYHTSFDTVEKLLPGSMQVRGENLVSLMKSFANSAWLWNAHGIKSNGASPSDSERPYFFDFYAQFMVFYSKRLGLILHSIPFAVFLLMPIFLHFSRGSSFRISSAYYDFVNGLFQHAAGIILAIIFPAAFAIFPLLFSSHSMHWFGNPFLAFLSFVPCSVMGLLSPRVLWKYFPLFQEVSSSLLSRQELVDESRFWGAFGFYSLFTLAYLASGSGGGFITFSIAAFMLLAWNVFQLSVKHFGYQSTRSQACYVVLLLPCLMYSLCFGGFLTLFLIEKMGMMGSLPSPYGYFVPDVIIAAVVGVVTGWCIGPLLPVVGNSLATSSVLKFLFHGTILAFAISSQFFPYSKDAPKRVVFQHTIWITDTNQILNASFDFAVTDSNPMVSVLKLSPEVVNALHGDSGPFGTVDPSCSDTWKGIFPISHLLFSTTLKFHESTEDVSQEYACFPHLLVENSLGASMGSPRKVNLQLSMGCLKEVWVAVLNITGPLSNWSFTDHKLPAPVKPQNGPPSYICRLSGSSHENWTFWLESTSPEPLRIDVAVVDLHLTERTKNLKSLFPDWTDVTAFTSFLSSYLV